MNEKSPVGVFDSGIGGLSICHSIRKTLPQENLIYFADISFSPYGIQPKHMIDKRSEYVVNFLVSKGCKAVVIACNTATVNSIKRLRAKFSIPIIGVEPGIKPAVSQSKSGVIGVLATTQTLRSDSFELLKYKFSKKVKIEVQPCPEFVDLVESLNHDSESALQVAEKYISPLLSMGCDQIILGCTHFSFLRKVIEEVVQGKAAIVDTAVPVAMELKRRLHELNIHNNIAAQGGEEFWTSGISSQVTSKVRALWGKNGVVYEAKP